MDKEDIVALLKSQFGEYLRDPEYKQAFEEAMSVFSNSTVGVKSSTDNFYLFLHTLLIHIFGKIKSMENKIDKWETMTVNHPNPRD